MQQARERVDAARAEVMRGAPETGPAAQPDKFVVIVPCALASEGCAQPAYAAKEAAEALGWRAQIVDGKETADSQNAAVRQALTLNPDGILTVSINPSTIQSSLAQAREEGWSPSPRRPWRPTSLISRARRRSECGRTADPSSPTMRLPRRTETSKHSSCTTPDSKCWRPDTRPSRTDSRSARTVR
ncbi:substrate-binding domain-containing protein (plasmid) [Microbacterium sp. NIBRBAC000506063]|nr:substrate-binding domain-containing protein [Microbacterium sp. NIBRBAC000506063]